MTLSRLAAALLAISLLAVGVQHTLDPDLWWHLRTGQLISIEGIPSEDNFSFTAPGREWVAHEWLAQTVMWNIYRLGGLTGLMLTFALIVAAAFWLVYLRMPGRPYLAALVVLLAAAASSVVFGVRPQMFNLLMTALFALVLDRRSRPTSQARLLWCLPALTAVWANIHGGVLIGIAVLVTVTAGEIVERWLRPDDPRTLPAAAIRRVALVTLVSLVAVVANPQGIWLLSYTFETLNSPAMRAFIQEWGSPDFHQAGFLPFAAMLAVGIVGFSWSSRRATAVDLLLFVGTAIAGLQSARNIPIFAIVSAPIVGQHLYDSLPDSAFRRVLAGQNPASRGRPATNWVIFAMALVTGVVFVSGRIESNGEAIRKMFPVAAVDFLEQQGLAAARGYNSYNWGGYLIWRDVKVFVDGRADVYGDEFLHYYRQTYQGSPQWRQPLDDFDVRWVLVERGSVVSSLLDGAPEWHRTYADDVASVYVRR